jgi:hypothetical protein
MGLTPKRTRPLPTTRRSAKSPADLVYIKTLLAEWAYAMAFQTSEQMNSGDPATWRSIIPAGATWVCWVALQTSSSAFYWRMNSLVRKYNTDPHSPWVELRERRALYIIQALIYGRRITSYPGVCVGA